ncbi:MAG: hypothetical protein IPO08_25120 [Xanthomonadales bacterium]|nr:hypothetical protein [Xanthomonadales bacterium]
MAKAKKDKKDLLTRIRQRYKTMVEADQDNRRDAMEDLKFALRPGEQWDEHQKKERGDRPCYEFNKIRVTGKRIVNDMRANRPQGKVRAVEDGDKAAAEALEGLARNLWHVSDGDTVIDYAGEYQVFGGMGAWRVVVDYADDDMFTQDIRVEALRNPFCLYADPSASDPIKRDAMDWLLTEKISKTEYERKWPKAEVIEFESTEFDDDGEWDSDERVRICEYWYKEAVERKILLLSDGRTVREEDLTAEVVAQMGAAGLTVIKDRTVQSHDIYMCIASGEAILEGPTKFVGKQFPFVVVYGEWVVIDGKPHWCGITRFAKDAQRSYNVSRTAITEAIASAPQAKYMMTPEQVQGLEQQWAVAHKENHPYLLYNNDPKASAMPQRMGGPEVPVALIQESQIASEEIKSVTGIFDASLGNRSNEQTGIAIRARQAQGEIATFNYADNMAKGIRRTWEILIDIIPKVYDTERMVRVLGVDGAEKFVKINGPDESGQVLDITRGKYDVAVTTGPGFSTQREMAAEIYTQMVQANPALFQIAGDLIFKAMDLPYSDKMAERMKAMLPPQIQKIEAEGKQVPPEAMAALAQADQMMQQVQQMSQLVQEAAAEAETGKADAEKAKAEVRMEQANLKTLQAQLDKEVAEFQKLVAETQTQMLEQKVASDADSAIKTEDAGVAEKWAKIEQSVAEYMKQAVQALATIQAQAAPQVVVANAPRRRVARIRRVNGELIGEMQDVEDQVAQS